MLIELLVCYRRTRLRPLLRFITLDQYPYICGEAKIAISVLISKSLDIDIIGSMAENSPPAAIMKCLMISSDDSIFDYILQRMEPFNENEKEFIRNSGYKRTEYLDSGCKRAELSFIEKFMRKNIIMHGQPLIIDSTQFNFSNKLRRKYKGVNHKSPLLFSNKPPTEDQERESPKAFRVTEKSQRKPRIQKRLLCNFANLDDPREVMEEMMEESIRAKQATIEAEKVMEEAKKECKEITESISEATAILEKEANIKMYPFFTRIDKEREALDYLVEIHYSHLVVFGQTKTLLNHSKSIKELNSIYYEVFMTPRRFSDPLKLERGLLELRNLYDILIGKFDAFQYLVGQYDKDIAIIAIQEIEAMLPSHPSFSLTNENYISSS